jgi:hypothetical protein
MAETFSAGRIGISASEARELRVAKGAVNHESYKEIYGRVAARIRTAAARGDTSLAFTVPPLIPGRPLYDIEHAVRYNVDKLRRDGFTVQRDPETDATLHVDWKPTAAEKAAGVKKKPKPPPPPPPHASFQGQKTHFLPQSTAAKGLTQKLADLKARLRW